MGFMAGYNEWGGGKGQHDRKPGRADLQYGMVSLFHLRTDDDERMIETSNAIVRME